MPEEWLTTAEAAELSGYHPNHIRRLLKQGYVDGRKWGKAWQVNYLSLMAYLDQIQKTGDKRGARIYWSRNMALTPEPDERPRC